MRTWQVERRKRTRHLIELGGLVVKSGIVDLTGDDRAAIFGALIWNADKLKSDQGERARALWAAKGMEALAVQRATDASTAGNATGPGMTDGGRRGDSKFRSAARHRAAAAAYAIKSLTDPDSPANSGESRPIKITAPKGTVCNVVYPGAVVAGNHETASRVVDAVCGALASVFKKDAVAAGAGSTGVMCFGGLRDGVPFVCVEMHGAGEGAGLDSDGGNAHRVTIGNSGNTAVEVMELTHPCHGSSVMMLAEPENFVVGAAFSVAFASMFRAG